MITRSEKLFNRYFCEKYFFIKRIFISFILILFFYVIILVNLYQLQILNFDFYKNLANKNRIKIVPIQPDRGIIYDRNGLPIAVNKITYNINIIPSKVVDLNKTLNKIKSVINLSDKEIDFFKKKYLNFSYSLILKSDLNESQLSKFLINNYRFPELKIKKHQHRFYPYHSILAHTIGYVSRINSIDYNNLIKKNQLSYSITDNIGKLGIERFYENKLHGDNGHQALEVNSIGNIIRRLYIQPPKSGCDIFLTIDVKLQNYIHNLLLGNRAAVIVTDIAHGEILAMISHPSFNPNYFVEGISDKKFKNLIYNNNYPLINRVTQGIYPPASTVKPYIIISALASGIINTTTTLIDPGWWKLPGSEKRYRDWKRLGHGNVNITKALEESVDTFFYQIAHNMGIENLSTWMNKFGYGKLTGIDLMEESQGNMPNKQWKIKRFNKPWYKGDTIPIGIGQGYWTATPLQMHKALLILINNGQIKTPHLLLLSHKKEQVLTFKENNNQFSMTKIDSKYWDLVKDGMYGVANRTNGTSYKNFKDTPYKVAAKSGTAQLYNLKTNELSNSKKINNFLRDHKLMIAFAPYDKPSIAISIILENGGENEVTVGNIMRKIFDYINKNSNFLMKQ